MSTKGLESIRQGMEGHDYCHDPPFLFLVTIGLYSLLGQKIVISLFQLCDSFYYFSNNFTISLLNAGKSSGVRLVTS